jgi:hypothetical protein
VVGFQRNGGRLAAATAMGACLSSALYINLGKLYEIRIIPAAATSKVDAATRHHATTAAA